METSWKNTNVERSMPEHSGNEETELHLTLDPVHVIVDLTGSQLCILLTAVFRRLNNSTQNIWKNIFFCSFLSR